MNAHWWILGILGISALSCAGTVSATSGEPHGLDASDVTLSDATERSMHDAPVAADRVDAADVFQDPRCPRRPCRDYSILRVGSGSGVLVRPDGRTYLWGNFAPEYLIESGGRFRVPMAGRILPSDIVQFVWRDQHGCLLSGDGVVRCWAHESSLLGVAWDPHRRVTEPVTLLRATSMVNVFVTAGTSIAIGRGLYSSPAYGESRYLGLVFNYELPQPIVDVRSVGNQVIASLLADGSIYTSRRYSEGGPNVSPDDGGVIAPRQIPLPGPVAQILSLSDTYGAVVMRDGTVMEWGGTGGVLYRNDNNPGAPPTRVPEFSDVAYIGQGSQFSCALSLHGTVRCWGDSSQGQLGIGIIDDPLRLDRPPPVILHPPGPDVALPPVRELRVGTAHACALTMDDEVYCWGDTRGGAVGNGSTLRGQPTPVRLNLPR